MQHTLKELTLGVYQKKVVPPPEAPPNQLGEDRAKRERQFGDTGHVIPIKHSEKWLWNVR